MLQAYISNVSPVSDVCCKCFMWMLHMLQWLYTCCKCKFQMFHLLQAYVSNVVASGSCCKSFNHQAQEASAGRGGPHVHEHATSIHSHHIVSVFSMACVKMLNCKPTCIAVRTKIRQSINKHAKS